MSATVHQTFFPISELSSYQQGRWTIKARVTSRGPMRTFRKGNGEGQVFSAELLDSLGGEIKASFFNESAKHFDSLIESGKVFTLSRGSIRVANRQFNTLKHRYELIFDKGAEIHAADEDAQIQAICWNFSDLRSVQTAALPCRVDLCCVIASFDPPVAFTSKDGKELIKRELTVVDDSALSLSVTLWGERAIQPDALLQGNPAVCLKGVVVKEFNGSRSGSLSESGKLSFGEVMPEVRRVQQWWSSQGGGISLAVVPLSQPGASIRAKHAPQRSLAELRSFLGSGLQSDKPEFFVTTARLLDVQLQKQGEQQALQYLACMEKTEKGWTCNRRLDQSGFCASCGKAGKAAPRLNLRCKFADFEDHINLQTFHEAAEQVLSMKATTVRDLEVQGADEHETGREKLEARVRERYFSIPLHLTVRAKLDSYNGETRANMTCIEARPVQRGEHGRRMLSEVQAMLRV